MTVPAEKTVVTRKFIRVRERNQITLPSEIISGTPIQVGDFLEVIRTADGLIHLRPTVLVAVNSQEALREESLADQDISAKRYHASPDQLIKDLAKKRKRKVAFVAAAAASK